jgi:hypothetical protein
MNNSKCFCVAQAKAIAKAQIFLCPRISALAGRKKARSMSGNGALEMKNPARGRVRYAGAIRVQFARAARVPKDRTWYVAVKRQTGVMQENSAHGTASQCRTAHDSGAI